MKVEKSSHIPLCDQCLQILAGKLITFHRNLPHQSHPELQKKKKTLELPLIARINITTIELLYILVKMIKA